MQSQITALNAAYGNGALGISFKIGSNAMVIADQSAPMGMRQIRSTELVCLSLPTDSIKLERMGKPESRFLQNIFWMITKLQVLEQPLLILIHHLAHYCHC